MREFDRGRPIYERGVPQKFRERIRIRYLEMAYAEFVKSVFGPTRH